MFLNPIMLAGLGGAALPLVLHLLARARYRTIDWGAMMFLEPRTAAQRNAGRIKQLLLLLVRMLMVALLAMALARPVMQSAGLGEPRSALVVILLDNSPSMAFERNGVTRLDQARRAALAIVAGLRPGDQAVLVRPGEPTADPPRPETDLHAVASRIAETRIGSRGMDMAAALVEARRLLDREQHQDASIFIITDRQENNWRNITSAFASVWNDPGQLGPPPPVHLMFVGDEDSENLAIESIRLLNPPAIENAPAIVEARVVNFGQTEQVAVPLVLTLGRNELARTTLSVPPGSSRTVTTSVRLPRAGSHILTATLEQSGGMTLDNVAELAMEVRPPLQVLIVSGDERTSPDEAHLFRNESDYLRLALSPFASSGQSGSDPAVVSVISPEEFNDPDRRRFPVIVLANVPRLSAQQVRRLEQYVYGGGGLLIAPGNLVRIEDYNNLLYRDGAGPMPGRLSPSVEAGASGTMLLGLDLNHPVFHFLQGRPDPIPPAVFIRSFPAHPGTDARVIARYRTGEPFLLERDFGRGRVMLMTTPLDADWSTLPLSNFYLPLVQSVIRHLSAGTLQERNLQPGQAIDAEFPESTEGRVHLVRPDGTSLWLPLAGQGSVRELRYTETRLPGRYTLRARVENQNRVSHYVVRPPIEESDLTPLSPHRLEELIDLLGVRPIDPEPSQIASALASGRLGGEWSVTLLVLVLILGAVEAGLARAWTSESV